MKTAVSSPGKVADVASMVHSKAAYLAEQRRFGELLGFLAESAISWNPYYHWKVSGATSRYITKELDGYRMLLDPHDTGISRTLLSYGTHEQCSTSAFRRELQRLKEDVDGEITALELGANIGYYVLLEASVLGERARIHAIEPAPANIELLERNVRLNGFEDVVDIEWCAIGETVEPVHLHFDESSNRHGVRRSHEALGDSTGNVVSGANTLVNAAVPSQGALTVQQTTVDEYLAERDIQPAAVNVLRMDVEGYEAEIFEGMTSVLEVDSPLVIYLEFHQNYLNEAPAEAVVTALAENGFEIVSAVNERAASIGDVPRWYGHQLDIETFEDLLAEDHYVELVLRR
ncbi:FkbM family methyltransferase [Halococcus sp. IIIV-5B]|uniref:FkbM family methyltransferase n=1 Tax=Halococcus sp. IIIV-5B TaxID=2321230 RepID=UPI001314A411|nr:FkbM family methyltransferase [Halococcus sp. IIIV-5B]